MKVTSNFPKSNDPGGKKKKKSSSEKPEIVNGVVHNPDKIRKIMKERMAKSTFRQHKDNKLTDRHVRVPRRTKDGKIMKGERLRFTRDTERNSHGFTVDKKTGRPVRIKKTTR